MAPKQKSTSVDPSSDPLVILFKSIGLTQSKAIEANKNPKSAALLKDLIERHNLEAVGLDEKQAVLVTAFAGNLSKAVAVGDPEKSFVVSKILEGKLKSVDQVSGERNVNFCGVHRVTQSFFIPSIKAATKYVESHDVPIDNSDFDKQCGVGMLSPHCSIQCRRFSYLAGTLLQVSASRRKRCMRRFQTIFHLAP